jgi:hypothetical protein
MDVSDRSASQAASRSIAVRLWLRAAILSIVVGVTLAAATAPQYQMISASVTGPNIRLSVTDTGFREDPLTCNAVIGTTVTHATFGRWHPYCDEHILQIHLPAMLSAPNVTAEQEASYLRFAVQWSDRHSTLPTNWAKLGTYYFVVNRSQKYKDWALWIGGWIGASATVFVLLAIAKSRISRHATRLQDLAKCLSCGYPLDPEMDRCPECGTPRRRTVPPSLG